MVECSDEWELSSMQAYVLTAICSDKWGEILWHNCVNKTDTQALENYNIMLHWISAVDWLLNPKINGFFLTNCQSQNNIWLYLKPACFLQQKLLQLMAFNL